MNNPITAATIASIGAPAPAHTVTVTWANGTRAAYSASMLDMLRTDPAALDIQDDSTGEIIYIKPDSTEAATEAVEGTEITAITYTTDDDPTPAPGLLIHRPGTTRGIIIGDGVMLPDDPTDLLTAYGEREYNQDAAGNYIITTDEQKEEDNHMSATEREATATEAATVAGIIRSKGGYRERIILLAPHTMTHGETWNAEHKVVNVLESKPGPDGYRAGCAVDIVTRSIVG